MAKRKGRVGYGVKPPYISFGEALEIVGHIDSDAGGTVSEDQLSSIMNNSVKSSSFALKLKTLTKFGLVSQENGSRRIGLSDLARRIVAPQSPQDRAGATLEAFQKIDVYRQLFELWAGKILPTDEFFVNTIRERCKIPSELTKQWKDSFMESGEAAGLLQTRQDGKIQLRLEPESELSAGTETGPLTSTPDDPPRVEKPGASALGRTAIPPKDVERFPIPLATEGKVAVVELPRGWTASDMRKMLHVMEAMFLWGDEEKK